MHNKIRVVLVDDHPLFLDGLTQTLNSQQYFEVIGLGNSAADAERLADDLLPDMMLLDISMPGSGIKAAKTISQKHAIIKIVMLTVSEHETDVLQAMESGARGYILKGVSGSELIQILKSISAGEPYVTPSLAAMLLTYFGQNDKKTKHHRHEIDKLTSREQQVLMNIAKGMSNKEIANNLFLSEKTIKHHVSSILQKLHVKNRVEAALLMQNHQNDDM